MYTRILGKILFKLFVSDRSFDFMTFNLVSLTDLTI